MPSVASTPPAGHRTRRAFLRALLVLAIVVALDRLTKHLVVTGIAVGEVHRFLPAINLVHVRNSGVAFGFFSGGGVLVLVLTLVALSALVVFFIRRPRRPLLWLPTGLIVGGAVGNLIDRLSSGSVTDFIKLPLWPAFNLADSAITLGVLALLYVLEGPAASRSEPAAPAAGSGRIEGAEGSRPADAPRVSPRVAHPDR
ncbi:MAG TPA: signal peptidase II [Solirubrobacteraceae bacterium]